MPDGESQGRSSFRPNTTRPPHPTVADELLRSGTTFASTFVRSTLFPQMCLKQYAGLYVDTLVVPVVGIRVSFAIRPSQFSLLISRWWYRIWKFSYKNENCFVFYPKLTSNLMSARRFTKFGPMIHFTCPTTQIIDIHIALYPFPCMVNFSFWRDYQVC